MTTIPVAGDILHDVERDEYILLLKDATVHDSSGNGYHICMWDYWNLTSKKDSWDYKIVLEDELLFRRV